jgi:hypothetical protein
MPTHRGSGKKINSATFVGHQMEGAKTIGWKPCLTGYTSGAYVLCHKISIVCFGVTDTLAMFPSVHAPLKREFNLNGNQTELQRHSKHSAYTKTTGRLMLFSEIIGEFSNRRTGVKCVIPLLWRMKYFFNIKVGGIKRPCFNGR